MLEVIKIAAQDEASVSIATQLTGLPEQELVEAASLFLQAILLAPDQSPQYHLGLPENATALEVTLHKRWLLKWLHPDRNRNKWQSELFKRVTDAAKTVADTEAMASTDQKLAAAPTRAVPRGQKYSRHERAAWKVVRQRQRHFEARQFLWRIARKLAVVSAIFVLVFVGFQLLSLQSVRDAVGFSTQSFMSKSK